MFEVIWGHPVYPSHFLGRQCILNFFRFQIGTPTSGLSVSSCPSILKLTDPRLDPTHDEGLASDSDYVTSSPTPSVTSSSKFEHYHPRDFHPAPSVTSSGKFDHYHHPDSHPSPSRIGLLRSGSDAAATDKQRKRRKGIGSNQPDNPKSGTGRSLTYPPQKKGLGDVEEKFTSVDSNGMKSLKALTERPDSGRMSDLSLADSQMCTSEGTGDETYLDVVDR